MSRGPDRREEDGRGEGGARRGERERDEREADRAEEPLTRRERGQAAQHRRLSAVTVYSIIRREGEEELHRPIQSLWWSGIAAGIGISSSVLTEAVLHQTFLEHPYRTAIENLGYTVGFVLVIISRLQLFTENTITVILPLLSEPTLRKLWQTARLWSIVFVANLIGTLFTALITLHLGTTSPEHTAAMLEVSRHFAEVRPLDALLYGIPAGFYLAAIVWMLPSSKGFELLVIVLFTYLIAAGEFTHVIAGSTEVFLLVLNGELGVGSALGGLLLPALVGNIIGGTGLFALLAYGQVRGEIER